MYRLWKCCPRSPFSSSFPTSESYFQTSWDDGTHLRFAFGTEVIFRCFVIAMDLHPSREVDRFPLHKDFQELLNRATLF